MSAREVVRCANCGAWIRDDDQRGWVHVDYRGLDAGRGCWGVVASPTPRRRHTKLPTVPRGFRQRPEETP